MIVIDSKSVEAIESTDEIVQKGPVYRNPLVGADKTGGFGVVLVTFSQGARLNFHTHECEQILYVTEGKGILATRNEEYVVTPGTVIFIPAGEDHWHGATEDSSFSHIAIYKGQSKLTQ